MIGYNHTNRVIAALMTSMRGAKHATTIIFCESRTLRYATRLIESSIIQSSVAVSIMQYDVQKARWYSQPMHDVEGLHGLNDSAENITHNIETP